jgi:hypothetical protein
MNPVSAYFDHDQDGSNAPFGVPRPSSLPAADPSYDICFLPKVQRSYPSVQVPFIRAVTADEDPHITSSRVLQATPT